MKGQKITAEREAEYVAVLRDPQYTSERQRCFALGVTPSGTVGKKFRELREKHGIPEPERDKRGGRRIGPADESGALRVDDIRKDDRLMYGKKRLIVLSVDDEGLRLRRMDGNEYRLSWRQFKANASQYTKVPAGDPQGSPVKSYRIEPEKSTPEPTGLKTKFEQVVERQKEILTSESSVKDLAGRKSATINQDFEDAVCEMEAEHDARKAAPKVVDRGDGYSEIVRAEPAIPAMAPVHIDLEMEDSADPVKLTVKSDPEDYTDPEWFERPIPRKGTVERAIWDKAYKEISEIQTLRSSIRTALDRGDRLPASEVDRYNKYVSKYGEEAGA